MNLKLSAIIVFTSTLIALSNTFPQELKDDDLELARAKFHDLAVGPAVPTFELTPSKFSDLDPHGKRDVQKLPSTTFYICSEPLLQGRCEKLASKRGFCYKLKNGWDNQISSFCPQALSKCTVYDDDNCKDPLLEDIEWPGIPDLTIPLPPNGASYVDNSIGSYSCI